MSASPNKPLITFAVFAYNQEAYVADAIRGALNQTYSPLEIILSDDCSVDRTFEIMQEMAGSYQGPHKIVLNRNNRNLNIGGHINHVMGLSKGEWIVVAAGDDVSLPERTALIYDSVSNGNAVAAFSAIQCVYEDGTSKTVKMPIKTIDDAKSIITRNITVHGCSFSWHRQINVLFGELHDNIVLEDLVIAFRATLLGSIAYIPKELVLYRVLSSSVSRPKGQNAQLHYFRHHLNAYSQMLFDLATYVEETPHGVKRALSLAPIIQRYYNYYLVRIGRHYAPESLSLLDHFYALRDNELRRLPLPYVIKKLKQVFRSYLLKHRK